MTLQELGDAMVGIYPQLVEPADNNKDYALMKEDARAYLPSNTECRKIYMTFTYKSLNKFLQLRESPAAQAEIRMYAKSIGNVIRNPIYNRSYIMFEKNS